VTANPVAAGFGIVGGTLRSGTVGGTLRFGTVGGTLRSR
jgi:hypothetical protein